MDSGDFQHILQHAMTRTPELLVEKRADVMRRYRAVLDMERRVPMLELK